MRDQLLWHIEYVFKRVHTLEENFSFLNYNLKPSTLYLRLVYNDLFILQDFFVVVTRLTYLELSLDGISTKTLLSSLCAQLSMKVFDFVFYDLRIAEAALINDLGAGFLNKWVSWKSFLEKSPLNWEINREIYISVRYDEIEDVHLASLF